MRLTLISHACWLIETSDITILTDPVFGDAFNDNMCTPCPTRRFNPDALPAIDAVYLSHCHHDHLDPPTLAGLARRVPMVLCAADTQYVMERVGFAQIQPIKDFQAITIGETKLHITPATNRLQNEHGLLVTDPDGRIWNQVDSGFKPEWLPLLRVDGRGLDVHLANFNAILYNEPMSNGVTRYPYAPYGFLLDTVRLAAAKLVIPGAVGLSWINRAAWLNNYLFPTSHRQFVEDVQGLGTGSHAEILLPGDMIEIVRGEPRVHRQARPELVSTIDPASMKLLDFNPTRPLPTLVEQDAATRITVGIEDRGEIITRNVTVPAVGFAAPAELEQAVDEILSTVNQRLADPGFEPLKDTLRRWAAKMQLLVHFPEGPRYWFCDFTTHELAFTAGHNESANYFLEVTAVDLHAVERGLIFDQFILTGYRCFHTLYRVRPEGIAYPVLPSQFHREVEAESGGSGDVPSPFEAFMLLWGPDDVAWTKRLIELSIAP
jgi:L-ascorbate metabolism protein UlaG (beta-lactamase superfamily)